MRLAFSIVAAIFMRLRMMRCVLHQTLDIARAEARHLLDLEIAERLAERVLALEDGEPADGRPG